MKIQAVRGDNDFLVTDTDEVHDYYIVTLRNGTSEVLRPSESLQATLKFGWWEDFDGDADTERKVLDAISEWRRQT